MPEQLHYKNSKLSLQQKLENIEKVYIFKFHLIMLSNSSQLIYEASLWSSFSIIL